VSPHSASGVASTVSAKRCRVGKTGCCAHAEARSILLVTGGDERYHIHIQTYIHVCIYIHICI